MTKKQEPGVIAKLVSTGLGALLLTEDSIRKNFKPLGIPRDASKYLIKQIERRKDDFMQILREELHQALSKVPIDRVAKEIVSTMDLELTVRFIPRRGPSSTSRHKLSHRWKSKR